MENPIILISGGTGIGTSTYARELANRLDIRFVDRTDNVRQTLRAHVDRSANPFLHKSTYTAGQINGYRTKSLAEREAAIVRGFEFQSGPIEYAVIGSLVRSIEENTPMIIEGVHLRPGFLQDESPFYDVPPELREAYMNGRIIDFCLDVRDPEVHKERLVAREREAPSRKTSKYLPHFEEIRWIQKYLVGRADTHGIHVIDNSRPMNEGIEDILAAFPLLLDKDKGRTLARV